MYIVGYIIATAVVVAAMVVIGLRIMASRRRKLTGLTIGACEHCHQACAYRLATSDDASHDIG